jgi:hypothetical protein
MNISRFLNSSNDLQFDIPTLREFKYVALFLLQKSILFGAISTTDPEYKFGGEIILNKSRRFA